MTEFEKQQKLLYQFISDYVKDKKSQGLKKSRDTFPTFPVMVEYMKCDMGTLQDLLKALIKRKALGRNVAHYKVLKTPEEIQKEIQEETQEKPQIKDPVKTPQETNKKGVKLKKTVFLVLVLATIVTPLILTVLYAKEFFVFFIESKHLAYSFSGSVTLAGIVCFYFGIKQKRITYLAIWLVITMFSVFTSITGQSAVKDAKENNIRFQNNNNQNDIDLYAALQKKIDFCYNEITDRNSMREDLKTRMEKYESDSNEYKKLYDRIWKKVLQIQKYEKDIDRLENEKATMIEAKKIQFEKIEIKSPFEHFQSMFNLDANILQLIIFVIIAILIDFLPVVGLHIILRGILE